MPSPFDEVREDFDLMVRGITDNAFRLATEDKDAPQKWAQFISTETVEADKQDGKPLGTTFAEIFDETVGRAAGTPVPTVAPGRPLPAQPQPSFAEPPVFQTPVPTVTRPSEFDVELGRLTDVQRAQTPPDIMAILKRSGQDEERYGGIPENRGYQDFIDHELLEATLVRRGMPPLEAHTRATEQFGEGIDLEALSEQGSARLRELFGADFDVERYSRDHLFRKQALARLDAEDDPSSLAAAQQAAEARIADPQEQQPTFTGGVPERPSKGLIDTFFQETPLGRGVAGLGRGTLEALEQQVLGAGGLVVGEGRERLQGLPFVQETEFDRVFQEARASGMSMTDAFDVARGSSQQIPFNAGEFFNPLSRISGVSAGVPGGAPVDFTIGTADLAAELLNPANFIPLVGETRLITGPARAAAGAARRAAPIAREAAEAAGRRATQAVGRVVPERKVFAEGVEDVGKAADEVLETEVAAAREQLKAPPEGIEPAAEIPGTKELRARKIITKQSEAQQDISTRTAARANEIPIDDELVANARARAVETQVLAIPAVDKIGEFLRVANKATKKTQDQITAQRKAGVAEGRRRARGLTDPIARIRAFRSGQAGRTTGRQVVEPLIDPETRLLGGLPEDVSSLAPTEAAQAIGIGVEDFDNLYRAVEAKWPIDSQFEFNNLAAQSGLTKVLLGELPQPKEIKLLRQVFGESFIKRLLARRPGKLGDFAFDLTFLLFKTFRSSWDASAPLRQLVIFSLNPRRVKQTGPMMTKMFKVGFTKGDPQKLANQFNDELINPVKNRHATRLLDPQAKRQIQLHDISEGGSIQFTDKEEVYASNIAAMLPGLGKDVQKIFGRRVPKPVRHGISATLFPVRVVGKGIRRSELMYATAINQTRMTIAGSVLDSWDEVARATNGRVTVQQESIDELINGINIFTGRGTLPFGLGEGKSAKFLNALFWAPKLAISRFQAPLIGARGLGELGLTGVAKVTRADPESLLSKIANSPGARARKELAKDLVAFVGTGVTILATLDKFGVAEVETDPRSSDFGKGKFGNLRIDFWGGFQQPARYVAQAMFGVQKRLSGKNKGELVRLGAFNRTVEQETVAAAKAGAKPTPPPNRLDLLYRFLQSKVAPGPVAITVTELRGKTFIGDQANELVPLFGEDIGPTVDVRTREALQQLLPLFGIDLIEAIEDQGVARGLAFGVGGALGVGVQTFGEEGTGRFNQEPETLRPTGAQ